MLRHVFRQKDKVTVLAEGASEIAAACENRARHFLGVIQQSQLLNTEQLDACFLLLLVFACVFTQTAERCFKLLQLLCTDILG